MPAYQAFAGLYDALMDDVDYDAWVGYYLALLGRMGVTPRTLCDCACGTGAMSVRFARQGMRVTGVDLSVDMLELARQKALQYGVLSGFAAPHLVQNAICFPPNSICVSLYWIPVLCSSLPIYMEANRPPAY